VKPFKFTGYFENEVLRKRPYLTREMCIQVVQEPAKVELQGNDRVRFWAPVATLGNRHLRVVTLEDRTTILKAFIDRGFVS